MNIEKFLSFNQFCPICKEPLSLYMQWIHGNCYKANSIDKKGSFEFKLYKDLLKPSVKEIENQQFKLRFGEQPWLQIVPHELRNFAAKKQAYFFWLCNNRGFKDLEFNDYEISMVRACYYRDSPVINMKNHGFKIFFESVDEAHNDLSNKIEGFSFKVFKPTLVKTYILRMDHEAQKTILWYYTVPQEKRQDKEFKPNLFVKELPFLKKRPKFELMDRNKLLERFDNWILMS
jgi:hypothetical protein